MTQSKNSVLMMSDFFHRDFKAFSQQDNVRSIPSVIDGLKDSQRKAVYGMMVCNPSGKELKVAQLTEMTSHTTHYEHGGASLEGTIVKLAQRYPGSNNVNLFEPIGQFGSILGPKSGAGRYIHTAPSKWFSKVFLTDDLHVLDWKYIDGDRVEPKHFAPTVPLWAVNGSEGIGTGYCVNILPRSLSDVRRAISDLVAGRKVNPDRIKPCFDGWTGTVEGGGAKWELVGTIERINTTKLHITEIPAGMGVEKLKRQIVKLMDDGVVKDYDNDSSDERISVTVMVPRSVTALSDEELLQMFGLRQKVTEFFTLWDEHGNLCQYDTIVDALKVFIKVKLDVVEKRRLWLIQDLTSAIDKSYAMIAFIEEWNRLDNPGRVDVKEIKSHMIKAGVPEEYLDGFLSMRLSSMTADAIARHKKRIEDNTVTLSELQNTTADAMYKLDLKQMA